MQWIVREELCGRNCVGEAVGGSCALFMSCVSDSFTEVFKCYSVACSSECVAEVVVVVQSIQTL